MDIEQHAEAAADEIDRSMTDGPKAIIAKHMQSAIAEATAPLLARIAELEGMGPLIESLEREIVDAVISNRNLDTDQEYAVAMTEIDAILKGGAS